VSWREQAACRDTIKTEVFYDSDPRIALAVCASCPSMLECRAEGDATETPNDTHGVRGGETEAMRSARRARGARPATVRTIKHGTRTGYQAHRGRGEDACDACRAAEALAKRIERTRRAGEELIISHIDRRRAS
jgi:hypothetical protein